MSILEVSSFVKGEWQNTGKVASRDIKDASTGDVIAQILDNSDLNYQEVLDYGHSVGGPLLRQMTFHDRARMLKQLMLDLKQHTDLLYELSYQTGATKADSQIDIDGGIGTALVFASKGRREMPDAHVYVDGNIEQLSREGSFLGQHICTPIKGLGIHINAFNFPIWGMLEKLAPTLLAGAPAIVKPASDTCYLTAECVRLMNESGILPEGSLQMIAGSTGNLLDLITCQDVVSFTGSAHTAKFLRSNKNILNNSIRFIAEQDSLNASILGPDITQDSPEFSLFIKEVSKEITVKAGQKCTAIRRIIVPENMKQTVIEALVEKLEKIKIGNPRNQDVRMGALVSQAQKSDVLETAAYIGQEAKQILGEQENIELVDADPQAGAFVAPILFDCEDPDKSRLVHEREAFGPVSTIMGYRDVDHASEIANRGGGSLVASVITSDPSIARQITLASAAWHGRLYFNNQHSMKESTGHGSPLPHLVHGGPGRAGGGEEMGGVRGVMHYMQRTAVQGSPDILTAISECWVPGSKQLKGPAHPFTRSFDALEIGESIITESRKISLEDIEHFAEFTGDKFYAHMDEEAAAANPFFPGRVAHGYLLLSFAAGLFVEPNKGPVLANTGLNNLSFMKPVEPGDALHVRLTVQKKTKRTDEYGEVRWHVSLFNQDDDLVAEYQLLTMNAYEKS